MTIILSLKLITLYRSRIPTLNFFLTAWGCQFQRLFASLHLAWAVGLASDVPVSCKHSNHKDVSLAKIWNRLKFLACFWQILVKGRLWKPIVPHAWRSTCYLLFSCTEEMIYSAHLWQINIDIKFIFCSGNIIWNALWSLARRQTAHVNKPHCFIDPGFRFVPRSCLKLCTSIILWIFKHYLKYLAWKQFSFGGYTHAKLREKWDTRTLRASGSTT